LRVAALTAATILSPVAAQAAPVTLVCAGSVTRTYVLKDGVVREPRKEPVSDYSVVLDLEKHAVFAFWYESTGHLIPTKPSALPIKETDGSGISFAAERKVGRTEGHIAGGVERATGVVYADGFTTYSGGASQHESWDLHCNKSPNAVLGGPLKRVAEPNP
jgi:hypothetical protein